MYRIRRSMTWSWVIATACLSAGCGSLALKQKERQMELVARDWSMTIRASQVVPVYPLTQDIQPGDVFLVNQTVAEQSRRFRDRGFMPTDLHGRYAVQQWLYWQVGGLGPMAGQLSHFVNYAPGGTGDGPLLGHDAPQLREDQQDDRVERNPAQQRAALAERLPDGGRADRGVLAQPSIQAAVRDRYAGAHDVSSAARA